MKVVDLRLLKKENRVRIAGTVCWEECDRPRQEVFFETTDEFGKDFNCNPHPFLVGCILPALRHREKRIYMDEEICPGLYNGLMTAMAWLYHWYGAECKPVQIEAKVRSKEASSQMQYRAGSFLSGGIDSLATLCANRLNFPLEHPGSIKDCIVLYGMNIESDNRIESFEQAMTELRQVSDDAGVTLVPVYTNIRDLDDDIRFFLDQFQGAILASAGHSLSHRLSRLYIASSCDIPHLFPWGSHPLLDPNYSSFEMRIRQEGITLSRIEKTKLVAEWDVALQNIKVCNRNWPSDNCGRCEKCTRVMLSLLALGVLEKTHAFPVNDVSEEQVMAGLKITNPYRLATYQDLLAPLEAKGRFDLTRAIRLKILNYHQNQRKIKIIKALKGFDKKYLGGNVRKLKKSLCHDEVS